MSFRSGIGYDVHRLAEGRPLVLGGITVLSDRGLEGHSDADVLTHAIMDALLGAAALGDIGDHFPDTDKQWKDARSIDLLTQVRDKLAQRGYAIRSLDASVLCEAPRLGPYRDRMRAEIATATRLDRTQVSVKFGTNEGMGFVGRGEGIACMATATIEWVG
ncbi:MAG: 2-C-methyl-D-erythritol 2,4-cyclodiphosphate synthase [Thermoleophilaceae bacterium]|jgi:2-C-methyl-D-erythritol 2,4-cyclodiphosphate synthase|nr:2-C-methyl-D-erythritol 2,4-cyclodiphosphate synthase [Thermoleophilaceae bacterium]